MRIAIFHFHLRPGGVTRVIEMACEALIAEGHDPLVLTGEPAPDTCRISPNHVMVIPTLAYEAGAERTDDLCSEAENCQQRHWGGNADVFHIHNHSLGKSLALPGAVARWAGEGRAIVLQMHDFAENGRPANYQKLSAAGLLPTLYPVASRIRFALLNSHDLEIFRTLDAAAEVRLLPNPIELPAGGEAIDRNSLNADRLILYPTRGIRRKNLGEAVLWAALAEPGTVIAISSAPQISIDQSAYEAWRDFAVGLNLPIVFDAMSHLKRPLLDLMLGADLCLTTSVAEGFGMAFLEPWLAGKSLAGRNLPSITRDFTGQGVDLDTLYNSLKFPKDWVNSDRLRELVARKMERLGTAYDMEFTDDQIAEARNSLETTDGIDFGRLDEVLQREVITHIVSSAEAGVEVVPHCLLEAQSAIAPNAQAIRQNFNLAGYAFSLNSLYQEVVEAPAGPVEFLSPRSVLKEILDYHNFFALKS